MLLFVWLLRILAMGLFALMIFPAGFRVFFGHGDIVPWSDIYVYLVVLVVSAYAVKIAWMQFPTYLRLVGGLVIVMLTGYLAFALLDILGT